MTWIFGSFLVTPCALASCHILIRCVTKRRPRDENHAVSFRQKHRMAVEQENRSRSEAPQTSLQGGASVGTHWLPEQDMGRSLLSEYLYHNLSLN